MRELILTVVVDCSCHILFYAIILGGSAEGTRNFAAALDSTVFFRPGHTCHSALAAKLRTASNADAPQCFARPHRNPEHSGCN